MRRTPATRSGSTCCCATSSTPPVHGRAAGGGPMLAASGPSTSPHRSGSATSAATSRSPTSSASCTPSSRSTGSPSIPSPRHSRRRASTSIPPAPSWRASRRHLEAEAGEHDLHAFQAYRRMDEILLANFMLFHDVADQGQYDLWIGDEAWELDYFLHENPELKSAAYVWLTDFVGWLPMPDGDDHGPHLTADYNAEMLEHVERYPRLRDRALFVGDPDDIVAATFGAELPAIRDWAEQHYAFTGYITGFDPARLPDRDQLRADLGYRPGRGGLRRQRRRLRRRRASPAASDRRLPPGEAARPRRYACSSSPGRESTRARCHSRRGSRLHGVRPRPPPPPRRLRPRDHPGRPDDHDGADRQPAAVPLLPAPPPLRAEPPRPPPARALPRRSPHELRHGLDRTRSRSRSPRRSAARPTTVLSTEAAPPEPQRQSRS